VTEQQAQMTDTNTAVHIVPPGERLREAREARKLSVDDVAAQLKLDVDKINALENSEVAHIVAPVFVAGYLRAYAKLLELPAEELIDDFDALQRMDSPSMNPASGPAANNLGKVTGSLGSAVSPDDGGLWTQLGLWVVIGVVVVIAGYWLWSGGDDEIVARQIGQQIEETFDAAVPSQAVEEQVVEEQSVIAEPVAEPALESEPVQESAPESPAEETLATAEPSVPESQLSLYYSEDSWTEVHDATGRRLMYRLGKAGMARTLSGVAPFDVRLGYVPGVSVMFNGESYDMSRFEGRRQARFRVGTLNDNASQSSDTGSVKVPPVITE
jgi:cytoskeleton protein RodZ